MSAEAEHSESDVAPDPSVVDWEERVGDGRTGLRELIRQVHFLCDACSSEDEANKLIEAAVEEGYIEREEGNAFVLPGAEEEESDAEEGETTTETETASEEPPEQESDAETKQVSEMPRDELEERYKEMEARMLKLENKMDIVERLLVGEDQFMLYDVDGIEADPMHTRLQDAETALSEHADKLAMFTKDDSGGDSPDDRARHLRQVLYNDAKANNGKARMDREAANKTLGGGLHRASVLSAMKRAADGTRAEDKDVGYTPINGASDLQPVESITYHSGKERGDASYIEIDLTDVTQAEARKNLTTGNSAEGV